jgi:DNA-binding Xre family transcriptional regulator
MKAKVRREVSYQWRLREVMAQHDLFTTTELVPLLAERGITLSASQVHRLVTGTPERLSLPVLAALCDILEVTPAELIATRAVNAAPRKTGTDTTLAAADLPTELRPRRARLRPEG